MSTNNYFKITAVIFTAVAIGHGLRAIMGWDLVFADTAIPIWVSALAALVTAYLAIVGYKASSQ